MLMNQCRAGRPATTGQRRIMFNVFHVTIHYGDGSSQTINVVSGDDVKARAAAIKHDWKTLKDDYLAEAPKVNFCEVYLVGEVIQP
jgi:hypothetical protein